MTNETTEKKGKRGKGKKATADTAGSNGHNGAAERKPRKAKQTQIPGTERNDRISEIEDAAGKYVVIRDERMGLTKKEVAAREVLRAAMKNHGQTIYECDTEDLTVTLIPAKEEKVKVTRRDADDDELEIEIED